MIYDSDVILVYPYSRPGYKGGGPVQSLYNLTVQLDNIRFYYIADDRDVGDVHPYKIAKTPISRVGRYIALWMRASYLTKGIRISMLISYLIRRKNINCVYFNTILSTPYFLTPLLFLRLFHKKIRIVVAPRGVLSPGAMTRRRGLKITFMKIAFKLLCGLDSEFHYTSLMEQNEAEEILHTHMKRLPYSECKVIQNFGIMYDSKVCTRVIVERLRSRDESVLRVLWHSRIVPKKNLVGCMEVLGLMKRKVRLQVFGVVEDCAYMQIVRDKLVKLPKNVEVELMGETTSADLDFMYSNNDVFLFLTHGENFGHVIHESIAHGIPCVLSDTTPWNACESGLVNTFSLCDYGSVAEFLDQYKMADFTVDTVENYLAKSIDVSSVKADYMRLLR